MDGKGRATDNICIERFWRSAKVERIYLNEYNSIKKLRDDVRDYMEFYNYRRFHETLDYKKPMEIYRHSLAINNQHYDDLSKKVDQIDLPLILLRYFIIFISKGIIHLYITLIFLLF